MGYNPKLADVLCCSGGSSFGPWEPVWPAPPVPIDMAQSLLVFVIHVVVAIVSPKLLGEMHFSFFNWKLY